jgi:hypothetical protein
VAKQANKREAQEPKSKALTQEDVWKGLLRAIYNNGLENGCLVTPDAALEKLLKIASHSKTGIPDGETPELPRLNPVNLMRRVHHIAVDLYYDTFSKLRKGAPPITKETLDYIYSLHKSGLSYGEIAIKLGLPLDTAENKIRSKDVIRKRLKTAKKKLNP